MGRVGWESSLQVSFLYLGFQPFSLSKSEGLGNKQNMLLNGEKKIIFSRNFHPRSASFSCRIWYIIFSGVMEKNKQCKTPKNPCPVNEMFSSLQLLNV